MRKTLTLLMLALLLSACASNPVTLNHAALQEAKVGTVRLASLRTEITHQVSQDGANSGAVAGGLIGVLVGSAIDSGVNSKRAQRLEALTEALGEYNPNLYLESALINEARGASFKAPIKVVVDASEQTQNMPLVSPSYVVSPDFSNITVWLGVSLAQSNDKGKDFRTNYISEQRQDVLGTDEENRQRWIDNPQDLVEKIETGLTEVTQKFVAEFNGLEYVAAPPAEGDYTSQKIAARNDSNTVYANIMSDEEGTASTSYPDLVRQLNSSDATEMRAAAKRAGEEKLYSDPGIIDACVSVLKRNLERGVGKKDKFLIDGLSWCALNLGNAQSEKSKPILNSIVESDMPKKLRSHAIHALKVINGDIVN